MSDKKSAAEFVTVACKIPNGLILRLFKMIDTQEPMFGGGFRKVKVAQQVGETYEIKGPALPKEARAIFAPGGYALTTNIPKAFFEEWLKQNHDHEAVVRKLIFAQADRDDAVAQAEEQAGIRSGLEPLNPEIHVKNDGRRVPVDPRWPRSKNGEATIEEGGKAA